jgi:1-aminocyclopropane-1-carboxylate deaminase
MFSEHIETPIQLLDFSAWRDSGVQVSIKREDTIHPFISGNKWRKLKYVLQNAKKNNKTHLVSFGGAYSNHLVALASAGVQFGFKTTAFVRGEEVHNHMLGLCKCWGMELIFVSREAYRNKHELFDAYAGTNEHILMIDEGGRGKLAAKGCEEILDDVVGYTHVCCAVGTGTTLAGLAIAAHQKSMIAEGFCVLKGAEEIESDIKMLTGHNVPVVLHHQFHLGGYAKTDEAMMPFIQSFARETGILLDQVYTAKMVRGVDNLIKQGHYPRGSNVLLIHTGGLLGLLTII